MEWRGGWRRVSEESGAKGVGNSIAQRSGRVDGEDLGQRV